MEEKKTVLLVEDDSTLIQALSKKFELSMPNVELIVARNGSDGLSMALEHHPDLILLDIIMPDIQGTQVYKSIRDDTWGKTAKIIYLTNLRYSYGMEDDHIMEDVGIIVKSDWSLEEIVEKIKNELN